MQKLPKLEELKLANEKVIVRMDLDVPEDDDTRLIDALPTLKYLAEKNCEIVILGHLGRPEGKVVEGLSLMPVSKRLEKLLQKELGDVGMAKLHMHMAENLRFDPGEEANDAKFAEHLAELGEFYINEAFAVSHRKHASLDALPRLSKFAGKKAAGLRFQQEVEKLSGVTQDPARPLVVVLGGAKSDKLDHLPKLVGLADAVLVGGRLPYYVDEGAYGRHTEFVTNAKVLEALTSPKVRLARLVPDNEDITLHSVEGFEQTIASAKTLVLAGPLGKFEEDGHMLGTKRVFEACANATAYKVVCGGDTQAAVDKLGLTREFDWISVGGGAAIEYITHKTLPGISALTD